MAADQDKLNEIFSEALARASPEARALYLAQACGADDALRRQVDSLLEAHVQSGEFLQGSVVQPKEPTFGEGPGSVIGRYKLLQQIGEGGFGIVFMAEQQEPVRRMVALKVIKAGMDTREVVARFEAERQALALMDHPNIAKIFDGGATESVVPDPEGRARHSVRAAVRSVESGPHGVASPPLETEGDGAHGVTRPAVEEGAQRSDPPHLAQPEGTPHPASGHPLPSDGRGAGGEGSAKISSGRPYFVMELVKGIPITDFCDRNQLSTEARLRLFMKVCDGVQHAHQKGIIHRDLKPTNVLVTMQEGEPVPKVIDFGVAKAIGQKLTERTLFTRFEQLIGTPAYMSPEQAEWSGVDIDTRSDIYSLGVLLYELLTGTTPFDKETLARAALDEVRRMIRETEPPMPSTRLQGLGQRLDDIAQRRQAEPSMLARLVRGDLDWIAMRAIEKDRARRYETVNALARDVERHLKGDAVVACPPSRAYLAAKFVRRHRMAVTAVAGVGLALVAGLVLALLGFSQARRATRQAKQDAATAEAISDFLRNDLLAQADPQNNTNRDLKLREVLDRASEKIKDRFANQPLVEASIQSMLGNTYNGLSEFNTAEPHMRRALELRTRELGPEHPDTLDALYSLAVLYANQEKRAEAEPLFKQLVAVCQRTLGPDHAMTLDCLRELGRNYLYWGRADKAENILRELVQQRRRLQGPDHPDTLDAMGDLAGVYDYSDRLLDAAAVYEEVLTRARSTAYKNDLFIFGVMARLGENYCHQRDYPRAVELLKPAVEFDRRVKGPRHYETFHDTLSLVQTDGCLGAWTSCVELCRELTAATNDLPKIYPNASVYGLYGATAALLAGDTHSYREFARREITRFGGTTNQEDARIVAEVCFLAPASLADLEPAFHLAESLPTDSTPIHISDRRARGMAAYRQGSLDEALKWFETPKASASTLGCQAVYFCAMIHQRQGDLPTARAELEAAGARMALFLRTGDLGEDWNDFGRVAAVRAEAERLILGREVSPAIDAASLAAARRQWEPVRRHFNQAAVLGGQRKWSEARDAYLAAMREPVFDWDAAQNADSSLPSKIEITFLLAGDFQNHAQLCRRLFDHLKEFPDPWMAGHVLAGFLGGEVNMDDEVGKAAATWVEACTRESDEKHADWASLLRAMAAYRSAKYQDTLEESKAVGKSQSLAPQAAAQLFRALALGKLGRIEEGREQLHQAETRLGQHLANMSGDSWWDLGLCQLTLDEAHRLFDGSH